MKLQKLQCFHILVVTLNDIYCSSSLTNKCNIPSSFIYWSDKKVFNGLFAEVGPCEIWKMFWWKKVLL